jgi:hypothetical protein
MYFRENDKIIERYQRDSTVDQSNCPKTPSWVFILLYIIIAIIIAAFIYSLYYR